MALIPKKDVGEKLVDIIYAAIAEEDGNEQWLTRIGASGIGNECRRALWYNWRGFSHKPFEGRILRLFNTGHLQEDRIVLDLKRAGATVWEKDESTGKQFSWVDDTGHFICKPDGVLIWPPYLLKPHALEIKTHNDKSFAGVKKHGVAAAKPEHVWQMNAAMWLGGFDNALYVALNKNDESYHIEVVPRNELLIRRLYEAKEAVITATIPPARISEDSKLYSCVWCDHYDVCTGQSRPLMNCRTCTNSEALKENGEWVCTKNGEVLSNNQQKIGCEYYEGY